MIDTDLIKLDNEYLAMESIKSDFKTIESIIDRQRNINGQLIYSLEDYHRDNEFIHSIIGDEIPLVSTGITTASLELQKTASMEYMVTSIAKIAKRIRDYIRKIIKAIKDYVFDFFNDLKKARKRINRAKEILKDIPTDIGLDYSPVENKGISDLCYYNGENHTVLEAINEIGIRLNEVMEVFYNGVPGLIDELKVGKLSVDDAMKIAGFKERWLEALSNSLLPIDPSAVLNKDIDGVFRSQSVGVADETQSVIFYSYAFPGDYRVISRVPISAANKVKNVKLVGSKPHHLRQFGDHLLSNDIDNLAFKFDRVPNPNIKDKHDKKVDGFSSFDLRQTVHHMDRLISRIEEDRKTIKEVAKRADSVLSEFDKLMDVTQQEVQNTEFSGSFIVRKTMVKTIELIDTPYNDVLKHTVRLINTLSGYVLGETTRYQIAYEMTEE